MAAYFLDSSALVKRFARESGTLWVLGLFKRSLANSITVARVTPVETVAGLAKQTRIGTLSIGLFERAITRLTRDMEGRYSFVEIDDELVRSAIPLVKRFGLRGFDVIQLASALRIATRRRSIGALELIFVSADVDLNKAALSEGLAVENPNDHS